MEYKNKLDKDYIDLIQHILETGKSSGDRTGTGTIKTFVNVLRHDMRDGFPLLTTKHVYFKGIVHELLWFLSGSSNIKYMVDNNVNIWIGDTYKKYCKNTENPISEKEFIEKIKTDDNFAYIWGELGPVYGVQWRNWNGEGIDQISNLISDLKTNPDSRRHIVTAWNPSQLKDMLLPSCHNFFQFFTEELTIQEKIELLKVKIENIEELSSDIIHTLNLFEVYNIPTHYLSVNFNMRSVDCGLGLPFDLGSYGLLLTMISKEVNMIPKELICTLNDTHIYKDQVEKIKEIFNRESHILPTIELNKNVSLFNYTINDINLINYKHSGKLNLPLSN